MPLITHKKVNGRDRASSMTTMQKEATIKPRKLVETQASDEQSTHLDESPSMSPARVNSKALNPSKRREVAPELEHSASDDEEKGCIEIVEPESWVERLTICASQPLPLTAEQVDDDAVREQTFTQHALGSVEEAIRQLEYRKISWRRPADFYAEMMKSDMHMHRVREELERSEESIRRRAQRRQESYQRKFSRELKSEHAKKEAERKRQLAIAVDAAKRRSAKRMKEEAETSRLFGSISRANTKKKGGYNYDEDGDGDEFDDPSRSNMRGGKGRGGRRGVGDRGRGRGDSLKRSGPSHRNKLSKKRPGKDARKRKR